MKIIYLGLKIYGWEFLIYIRDTDFAILVIRNSHLGKSSQYLMVVYHKKSSFLVTSCLCCLLDVQVTPTFVLLWSSSFLQAYWDRCLTFPFTWPRNSFWFPSWADLPSLDLINEASHGISWLAMLWFSTVSCMSKDWDRWLIFQFTWPSN